jgi:hypothetical protein
MILNHALLALAFSTTRPVDTTVSHPPVAAVVLSAVTVDEPPIVNRYGDFTPDVDDLTPATCDLGTGFWMVTSTRQAHVLQANNPGTFCEYGIERYGPVE